MRSRSRTVGFISPGAAIAALLFVLAGSPAAARILSYSPVTDRAAFPAIQFRTARHFALVESEGAYFPSPPMGRLILYDSTGETGPRILFPTDGSTTSIYLAAVFEETGGVARILVLTDGNFEGSNPGGRRIYVYSPDGGAHWMTVPVPGSWTIGISRDFGGPVVRGNNSEVRLGNRAFPFVVAPSAAIPSGGVFALGADGTVRLLFNRDARLLGSDPSGTRFLIQDVSNYSTGLVEIVDLNSFPRVVTLAPVNASFQGWITSAGNVYLLELNAPRRLLLWTGSDPVPVVAAPPGADSDFFAVPTADGTGAWIVQGGSGLPTVLSRHTPEAGLAEQWRDPVGPRIEALHAAASGERLLIQVHRDRPRVVVEYIKDPALAIWRIGDPPPADYHELFLNEGSLPGFDHLDVDAAAAGEPFVFDSGSPVSPGGVAPSAGGGGGDAVVGDTGHVWAGFRQRLILPIAARLVGRAGLWTTDLVVRNPSLRPARIRLLYTTSGQPVSPKEVSLELDPREIRTIEDAVGTLFGLDEVSGALEIDLSSEDGIEATSYLTVLTATGRYGTAVPVSDSAVAPGARFPWTFAAALLDGAHGAFYAVDVGGRGSEFALRPASSADVTALTLPPSGNLRTSVDGMEGAGPSLRFEPATGQPFGGLLTVDDSNSDPTWFSADLLPDPSPLASLRCIPAVIHADGVQGTQWRTDLFLFNASSRDSSISLGVKDWNTDEAEMVRRIPVKAGQSMRIDNALQTIFGRSGTTRLLYGSDSVRITARVRSVSPAGGTVSLAMPPLNSFQAAGVGEALEILVPVKSAASVSLTLVDLANPDPETPSNRGRRAAPPPRPADVTIDDGSGAATPAFRVDVPTAGGIQVQDLLRQHPPPEGATGVMIRIAPTAGLIGAFATLTQDGTRDPAYFRASLAAH